MKNKKITIIRIALICFLCISIVILLFYDIPAGRENSGGYSEGLSSGYHIQIVTEKDRDYFWDDFKTGAERAAEEKKYLLSLWNLKPEQRKILFRSSNVGYMPGWMESHFARLILKSVPKL